MRAAILVLILTAAASAAAAEEPGSQTYVAPDWLKMPSADDLWAVWPRAAMAKGLGGRATMECEVEPQGTLERCEVISDDPAGLGFGPAALLVAPSFVMKPATLNGHPVKARVRIPVVFTAAGPYHADSSIQTMSFIPHPVWASAPSFADMQAAWPARAKADAGHVSMRCRVTRGGTLHRCEVLTETPERQGFGSAARTLVAPKFRLRLDPGPAGAVDKAYVNLAIHFNNPALNTPRAVVEPTWITTGDPAKAQAIFPARAANAGLKAGKGFADCAVASDGRLADCKPSGADPDGMGFAEAAVEVASVMQMNPWTDGGGPVDGVRIRIPIAFNLAPPPDAAPAKP